jgi:hypothetical protein
MLLSITFLKLRKIECHVGEDFPVVFSLLNVDSLSRIRWCWEPPSSSRQRKYGGRDSSAFWLAGTVPFNTFIKPSLPLVKKISMKPIFWYHSSGHQVSVPSTRRLLFLPPGCWSHMSCGQQTFLLLFL